MPRIRNWRFTVLILTRRPGEALKIGQDVTVAVLGVRGNCVRIVLATLALLGILITFFFKFVGPPNFPFWTMLAISIGFGLALLVYYALMRLFSR